MSYYIINHFVNDFTKSYFKIQYIQIPDLDMKQNSFEKKKDLICSIFLQKKFFQST